MRLTDGIGFFDIIYYDNYYKSENFNTFSEIHVYCIYLKVKRIFYYDPTAT